MVAPDACWRSSKRELLVSLQGAFWSSISGFRPLTHANETRRPTDSYKPVTRCWHGRASRRREERGGDASVGLMEQVTEDRQRIQMALRTGPQQRREHLLRVRAAPR